MYDNKQRQTCQIYAYGRLFKTSANIEITNIPYQSSMMQINSLKWIIQEAKILTFLGIPTAIIYFTEGMQAKLSNIFIGRSSGKDISMMWSALFIAQIATNLPAYSLSGGLSAYVSILCSQAYGAKQYRLVGLYFYRALFMAALAFFPTCTFFICVRPFVFAITQDRELAFQAGTFMSIFCFGYPPYIYHRVAIALLQAQNIVWPSLFYLILGNISNGVLQYFLIMQYNTGIAGAAAGYVISMYLISVLLYAHIRFTSVHTLIHVDWTFEMIGEWCHTAQYAIPTTIQMFAPIYIQGVLPLIILGIIAHDETQIGIYSVLYSVWFIVFIFAIGFGSSLTVRLGQLLGANEPSQARRVAIFGFIFGGIVMILNSLALFILSEPLGYLFTNDKKLAIELAFSVKILSLTILADIILLQQALTNACCLQKIDAFLKFVLRIVIGTVVAFVWSHNVEWKALSLLATSSMLSSICTLIALTVISRYDWKTIALNVSRNTGTHFTQNGNDIPQVNFSSNPLAVQSNSKIYNSKKFIIIRYYTCLLLSIIIFIIVFFIT